MRRIRLLVAGFGWLASSLVAPSAHAGEPDADTLIEHGIQLRERGHDDQALVDFQQAFAIAPTPRASAQLGLAEQALGQWVYADDHVRSALAANDDAWIQGHREVLAGALAVIGRHIGSVQVLGVVGEADLLLDGQKVATLPMPGALRAEVGTRTLEVRAPGFYRVSRLITVSPGEVTRETVDLLPLPAADGAVGRDLDAGAKRAPSGAPTAASPAPENGPRTLGWILLATAGAAVVTGVAALVAEHSNASDYNANTTCPGTGSASQPGVCSHLISAESTWKTVSIVSFIAGGVAAVTSVTLLATSPSAPRVAPASGSSLSSMTCSVRAFALTCGGNF